jgi:hypothetical protein
MGDPFGDVSSKWANEIPKGIPPKSKLPGLKMKSLTTHRNNWGAVKNSVTLKN